MIAIQVCVSQCHHDLADGQIALLCQHMDEQGNRGNIEGQTQKHIAGSDVELSRQGAPPDIKLIEQMTGRQRHTTGAHIILRAHCLIRQILDVPGMK